MKMMSRVLSAPQKVRALGISRALEEYIVRRWKQVKISMVHLIGRKNVYDRPMYECRDVPEGIPTNQNLFCPTCILMILLSNVSL